MRTLTGLRVAAVWLAFVAATVSGQETTTEAKPGDTAGSAGVASAADSPAVTLVTTMTAPQRPGFEQTARTRFGGRWAVGFDADDDAIIVYDLRNGQWFDWTNRKWVTRNAAEAWAEESRRRSAASAARPGVDEAAKRLLSAQMEPSFKVERGEGRVTLSNDVFTYAVKTRPLPPKFAGPFMTQQRLSAHFQAMTERKFAPFPLLAVLKELEAQKVYAEQIDLTIRVKGTEQKLVTSMRLDPPDADHDKRIADALALTDGPPPDGPDGKPGATAPNSGEDKKSKDAAEAPLPF